jgi:hypothetical protein
MQIALSQYASLPGSGGKAIRSQDADAFGSAFMLNDNGSGVVDGYAKTFSGQYARCLSFVNGLLATGIESHACAAYVATDSQSYISSNNGKSPQSGSNSANYSIYFENCPAMPPDDLTGS